MNLFVWAHPSFFGRIFSGTTFCLAASVSGVAAEHVVDSIAALKSKIFSAAPGDTITLKNGAYVTSGAITVRARGTAVEPITIAAESVGGVELSGTNGFSVVEPAEHVVIRGFMFTHASGKNTIGAGTAQVRFTRNVFQCTGDGAYLSVAGDDAQIDFNEFRDKKTVGAMLAVGGTGSQVARRLWVHHNEFRDFASAGGTTAEMIRFGLSALALSNGAGLVEHNLFVRCRGENEIVTNRSSGNTYRYNTFLESPSSHFTLRAGHDCVVYGNVFRNTEGLRIYGDRHQVFSNYFEGNYIGVALGNGDGELAEGAAPTVHDRPDHCVIVFNTFVDNRTHYQLLRRPVAALGATHTTFANNLIAGTGVAARIYGPYSDAIWSGNLVWTSGGVGDLPAEGYTKSDPLLVAGPDGRRRPQPGSPVIATAVGEFPLVKVDLDGRPRPEKKSRGADEISAAPAIARGLTLADVGPLAPEAAVLPR